jgi:hypothetical protein
MKPYEQCPDYCLFKEIKPENELKIIKGNLSIKKILSGIEAVYEVHYERIWQATFKHKKDAKKFIEMLDNDAKEPTQ